MVRRSGVTVIVIMVMIVSSLALAYMIGRSQVATIRLQSNSDLDLLARQAAMTGFANGLRSMYEANWAGIGTTTSTTLNSQQSFSVTYTTGDALLTATDTNWPYRVTILVVGTAVDLAHPVSATHQDSGCRAVVAAAIGHGARQLGDDAAIYGLPVRDRHVRIAVAEPNCRKCLRARHRATRQRLSAVERRTATIPVRSQHDAILRLRRQSSADRHFRGTSSGILTSQLNAELGWLGVSTSTSSTPSNSTWAYPGQIVSYQLYPGGQTYTVPLVSSSLQNTTLAASPRTNPLGIFYNSGTVTIGNNVTLTGTLWSGGDVVVSGTNVVLQPLVLPSLQGSTQGVQLPTVVVAEQFQGNEPGLGLGGRADCLLELVRRVAWIAENRFRHAGTTDLQRLLVRRPY